jgi:ribosome-associated toxin RatA of RatAB toxin-antitoxin module
MSPRVLLLAALFLSVPSVVSGDDDPILWETTSASSGHGEVRTGTFELKSVDCGYSFMADVNKLLSSLEHLEKVELHEDRGSWQDATYHERFFLVGLVQSRYHRTLNSHDEVSWVLVDGRQKRHDGTWKVTPSATGATVRFDNVIEAKSRLHNGLLRRIQKRTMSDIARAALEVCAPS